MMHVQKMIILILLSLFCPSYGNYLELQLSEELYNIDIDNETNIIFIGGKNLLLKASSTLNELKRITTGPKMDYKTCLESRPDCAPENTDNRNKILLVDSRNKKLITCGSLKHGVCQGRNLETHCQWKFQTTIYMWCQILIYLQWLLLVQAGIMGNVLFMLQRHGMEKHMDQAL